MFRALALAMVMTAALSGSALATVIFYDVTGVGPGDKLNVRSTASSRGRIVGVIPPDGHEIEIIGVGPRGWVKISRGKVRGYVARRFLTAANSATLAAETPVASPDPVGLPSPLRCFGTEPFWSLTIAPRGSQFETADGETAVFAFTNLTKSSSRPDTWMAAGATAGSKLALYVRKTGTCSDGMSDTTHPYEMSVHLSDGRVLSGCCKAQP